MGGPEDNGEKDVTSSTLGARLRSAREAKSMSLRALANAVGVSPSLLSQVETGKTQPSVSTLYAVVSELGISTDELLGLVDAVPESRPAPPPSPAPQASPMTRVRTVVQRATDNPVIEMENGVRWERLAIAAEDTTEALHVTYEAGASSSIEGKLMRHFGVEHAYILEGELTVRLRFEEHVVRAGDSLVFDAETPHLYENRTDRPVRGIWFVTGRREASADGAREAADETAGSPTSAVDVLRAFQDS